MQPSTILIAILVALLAPLSVAQQRASAPTVIDYCELVKNAQKYSGTEVSVRGWVSRGYEDFSLHGDGCGEQRRTWLDYGDDADTLDRLNRFLKPKFTPGFRRDKEVERLIGLLRAFRVFQPNGEECGEWCSYYKVYATITGLFLAPDFAKREGFGHVGCCYELLMRQISAVTPQRTAVPFGGRYECSTEYWTPTAEEYKALWPPAPKLKNEPSLRDGFARRERMFSSVAAHWGETLPEGGRQSLTDSSWVSPDLLRIYTIIFSSDERKKHSSEPRIISRQVCVPLPNAEPIDLKTGEECAIDWSYLQKESAGAEPNLEAVAHRIMESSATSWKTPAEQLRKNICMEANWSDTRFGQCSFTTDDGMHSVYMQFSKEKVWNKPWEQIPWKIVRGAVSNCSNSAD